MSERDCKLCSRKCDVILEQDESENIDPKNYCYNITSKVEVCKPGTCTIKRRKEIAECMAADYKQVEEENLSSTFLSCLDLTCLELVGKAETVEGLQQQQQKTESGKKEVTNTKSQNEKSESGEKETTSSKGQSDNNGTEHVKPADQQKSPKEASNIQNENRTNRTEDQTTDNQTNKSAYSSQKPSSGKLETPREMMVAVDECQCCNCYPCECEPRGIVLQNVVAALKAVNNSEELGNLLHELSPEARNIIDDVLMKETKVAAIWATGGAMNYIRGIEDENFKETIREAWIRGFFDEMSSCQCLPNMCPCPGDHNLYGIRKEQQKKKKQYGKQKKKTQKEQQMQKQNLMIKHKLSDTCVCPPTKHYLTPATSGTVSSDELTVRSRRMFWRDLMICSCPRLERTLAILKPDVAKYKDVVLRAIKKYGFDILNERKVQLSPEEASELYTKYYGRTQFPNMIVAISFAPIIVFSLGGISAVEHWKNLVGPDGVLPGEWFLTDWIERKHGLNPDMPETLHASGNLFVAERENRYFFPDSIIDPVMKNSDGVGEYINKYVNPTLVKGLAMLTQSKPIDPITFLAEWLLNNNPFHPHLPAAVCLAPT